MFGIRRITSKNQSYVKRIRFKKRSQERAYQNTERKKIGKKGQKGQKIGSVVFQFFVLQGAGYQSPAPCFYITTDFMCLIDQYVPKK